MQIKIDGVMVNYEKSGAGKDIILLHGWGMDLHTFDNLTRELNEDFTVYQVDLPGFGLSNLPYPFKIDDYVELINEFCCSLKIKEPIILGHSFGGRIALKYASTYKVHKLIIVASPGIKEKFNFIKFIKIRTYKILKKMKINVNMGSKDYKMASPILKQTLVMAVNEDLSLYLSNIKAPTLLIYGQKDNVVPIYIGKKLNNMIKNSGLVIVPNAKHFPYIEKFRYFLIVMKHFLLGDNK